MTAVARCMRVLWGNLKVIDDVIDDGTIITLCAFMEWQVKSLKSKHIIAVGAGRYHTALCTETELYTVGKNLGQLGYEKAYETQVAPRAVSLVKFSNILYVVI